MTQNRTSGSTEEAAPAPPMPPEAHPEVPNLIPDIPDQSLLSCIGWGAYGQVWLSRSVTGLYRAVKIIFRNRFDDPETFEREFNGLRWFERVCLTHPGLVALLNVGRRDDKGYYYYVMEVADDLERGEAIQPVSYRPKTLRNILTRDGRFPLDRAFDIAIELASALVHLQRHQLIHRDIKPSNIIFVRNQPKYADIGLVTPMAERTSQVGTLLYTPPEGPGGPTTDIYSLGRVLYELITGFHQERFPELPADELATTHWTPLMQLNDIITKACAYDVEDRYQSAEAFLADLHRAREDSTFRPGPRTVSTPAHPTPQAPRFAVLARNTALPDNQLLEFLQTELPYHGGEVFIDKSLAMGPTWASHIAREIESADVVVALLSASSVESEIIAYELELAEETSQARAGQPVIIPVLLPSLDQLPEPFGRIVGAAAQPVVWGSPADNPAVLQALIRAAGMTGATTSTVALPKPKLEPPGGAVPLDSTFYIERTTDAELLEAVQRKDSIVLLKGSRQIGKTSLLARGLQKARAGGSRVVLTDFQKLDANHLSSVKTLFLKLGDFLADQLGLNVLLGDVWDERRSPNTNFERYLRRVVFENIPGHLVWGMDEVDRLFGCPFASEVFGLLRSWHNERALDPSGPWSRLTLLIAYATEAQLFISDLNQSPFNVGTRLRLEDFDKAQVTELNRRYGQPLQEPEELDELFDMVAGHPFLVRQALHEIASGKSTFAGFCDKADREEGLFGDHLRRILMLLSRDEKLCQVVREVLRGRVCRDATSFHRLQSAGLMNGSSPESMKPRCRIYESYLKKRLLEHED